MTNLILHEFVIGFGCPGVNFDRVLQGNDQELDAFILDYLKVNGALNVPLVQPAVAFVVHATQTVLCPQNLVLQPRQIVHSQPILLPANRHQDILILQHLHLLETSSMDQLINCKQ